MEKNNHNHKGVVDLLKMLTVEEFKVLIMITTKSGNKLTLQSNSSGSPHIHINLRVERSVPIHNGIQFHVGDGFINIEFDEVYDLDYREAKKYEFVFEYDDDRPKGYWLKFNDFRLFFPEKGFVAALDNIKLEVEKQRKRDKENRMLRDEANRNLDPSVTRSIDNMMED
ncbi:hypothetical protein D3C73_571150 [compost metagenome]